jgi:hypothetical protein
MIRARALFGPLLVAVLMVETSPSVAQPDVARRQTRFEQVLSVMGDDGDRKIDAKELERLLRTLRPRATELLEPLREAGLAVAVIDDAQFDRFIREKAIAIMNKYGGTGNKVGEAQLARFEAEPLPAPFTGFIKDLLPPPPDSVAATEPPRPSTVGPTSPGPSVSTALREWISVRRSVLDANDLARPAALSLTHFGNDDQTRDPDDPFTSFNVRGALIVAPPYPFRHRFERRTLVLSPFLGIDLNLNSGRAAEKDTIVHRVGGEVSLIDPLATWSAHIVQVTFDYTTDRSYDSALLGGTLQYTPNVRRVGIGEYKRLAMDPVPVRFRWRPYVGITGATVRDAGRVSALQDMADYVNPFVKLTGELLISDRLRFVPEFLYHQQLRNSRRGHLLSTLSLRYSFDDDDTFSVEAAYVRGEDSPDFIRRDEFGLAFGVKF